MLVILCCCFFCDQVEFLINMLLKLIRSSSLLKFFARLGLELPLAFPGIVVVFASYCISIFLRLFMWNSSRKPNLLWGTTPIIGLAYLSNALRERNYLSDTVVLERSPIYNNEIFDFCLKPQTGLGVIVDRIVSSVKAYSFFARAILKYDIFHYYFDGGILRNTLFAQYELFFLKLARKKIVLMPYGSDAFVYDLIANYSWRHGLMLEYGQMGNFAHSIQKRLRKWSAQADVVVGCLVHIVNLPRWDILPLTCYPVDLKKFEPVLPNIEGEIRIAHATNHRGIKGTAFLIDAVNKLQAEGYPVKLDIIERTPNHEALIRIAACDIYVDQLIFGYALAALEAMAAGKVVISAIDNDSSYTIFKNYSYLSECPIVPASVETIYDVLKKLISERVKWPEVGQKSRSYVEKRHSFQAFAEMFEAIYQKIFWNQSVDLINLYHPLQEYKKHPSLETSEH